MKRCIVEFKEKSALIKDLSSEKMIKLDFPPLTEKIYLPVHYHIDMVEGAHLKRIGRLSVWMAENYPIEDYHIRMVSRNRTTYLSFKDEQTLVLKSASDVYEIMVVDERKLNRRQREKLKKNGFFKGYDIKRNVSVGSFYLFRKESRIRGLLEIEEAFDLLDFLPLIVLDRLMEELKDKEAKVSKSVEVPKEAKEGRYRNFVLLNYPVNRVTEAVEYVDQRGEWELFCELMDKGKPVLLNGPTGCGKSTMIKYYAYINNLPFYMSPTGNRETTMDDIVGSWVPADPKPIKAPGALILAMVHNGIFYFEEIGPVDPGVLYGLHGVLDDRKITVQSQYGFEVIEGGENFKIVSSGNLDSKYTSIELSDAFLERWAQIRMDYPDKEGTIKILKSRAPKVDDKIAEMITDLLFDFREVLKGYRRDMGLRGAVEVCQAAQNANQPLKKLIEVHMLNPKSTYESDRTLYKKLMEKIDKRVRR